MCSHTTRWLECRGQRLRPRPAISPAYAREQVARVARERRLPVVKVQDLVAAHTQSRVLGFLGEPRVNVLELDLALDALRG